MNINKENDKEDCITKTNIHLILDMDQTLIDTDENYNIYKRPYLEEFLNFCFSYFESVSIWTASAKEWTDQVFNKVLLNKNWKFRFVWCEKCNYKFNYNISSSRDIKVIKRLQKVWNEYKDMNYENTIIIDDNLSTIRKNINNSIHIPPYNYKDKTDNYLYLLQKYLIQKSDYKIEFLDKLDWYNKIDK
jgi:TFIIF-interacting CTD phosphatase-like protein